MIQIPVAMARLLACVALALLLTACATQVDFAPAPGQPALRVQQRLLLTPANGGVQISPAGPATRRHRAQLDQRDRLDGGSYDHAGSREPRRAVSGRRHLRRSGGRGCAHTQHARVHGWRIHHRGLSPSRHGRNPHRRAQRFFAHACGQKIQHRRHRSAGTVQHRPAVLRAAADSRPGAGFLHPWPGGDPAGCDQERPLLLFAVRARSLPPREAAADHRRPAPDQPGRPAAHARRRCALGAHRTGAAVRGPPQDDDVLPSTEVAMGQGD